MIKTVAAALGAGVLMFSSIALADQASFDAVDKDGDGVLTMGELATAFGGVSDETFEELDADGDGALSFEEFENGLDSGMLAKS